MDLNIISIFLSGIIWIVISITKRSFIEKNRQIIFIVSILLFILVSFFIKEYQTMIFNIYGGFFIGEWFSIKFLKVNNPLEEKEMDKKVIEKEKND